MTKILTVRHVILLSVIFLFSCSSTPWQKSITLDEELPPRPDELTAIDDTEGKITRVITRIRQPIAPSVNTKLQLLNKLEQTLDRELGKAGVSMVNRNLGKIVSNERELAEMYGSDSGRENVDVVLLVVLDEYQSSQNSEMKEGMISGKKYSDCKYNVSFKGWVRAYEIPSMKTLSQWDFEEDKNKSFDEPNNAACSAKFQNKRQALTRDLVDHAICQYKGQIINKLSPTGHILSVRNSDEKTTLEISLGSSSGIKKGSTVKLYHDLSNEHYGKGKVVGSITKDRSYIELTSLEKGSTVHEADYVRPYTTKLLDALHLGC